MLIGSDQITGIVERVVGILEADHDALDQSAERLLEAETLSGDELPVLDAGPGTFRAPSATDLATSEGVRT